MLTYIVDLPPRTSRHNIQLHFSDRIVDRYLGEDDYWEFMCGTHIDLALLDFVDDSGSLMNLIKRFYRPDDTICLVIISLFQLNSWYDHQVQHVSRQTLFRRNKYDDWWYKLLFQSEYDQSNNTIIDINVNPLLFLYTGFHLCYLFVSNIPSIHMYCLNDLLFVGKTASLTVEISTDNYHRPLTG